MTALDGAGVGVNAGPTLDFRVTDVVPDPTAAAPTLEVRLRVGRSGGGPVQSLMLNALTSILPARRGYDAATTARLADLFGAPERWDTTLRDLVWHRTSLVVGCFEEHTTVALHLPCSLDTDLAASKYLMAVRDGDVTLGVQFSGTVFYRGNDGGGARLRTAQLPWDSEASTMFPVSTWRELLARYHGSTRVVALDADTFDRLMQFRTMRCLSSFDEAIDALLPTQDGES